MEGLKFLASSINVSEEGVKGAKVRCARDTLVQTFARLIVHGMLSHSCAKCSRSRPCHSHTHVHTHTHTHSHTHTHALSRKGFFEAVAQKQAESGKFEAEIKAEQEENRKKAEEAAKRKAEFKAKMAHLQ